MPGLGHGVLDWMAQVGAAVPSPMTLLREYTTAVRDLLHGRTVDVDGRFVHLDRVTLDWPPTVVPPVLIGARGPRTLRPAGELADGVIFDSGITPEGVRASRVLVDEGRAAAGRTDALRIVVYVQVATGSPAAVVESRVADSVRELAGGGADTVVVLATGDAPVPEPLIGACAEWRG